MYQLMGKLLARQTDYEYYIFHYCPACDELHPYTVNTSDGRPNWTFNNNIDKPSFQPSMLIRSGHYAPGGQNKPGDCAMCDAEGYYGACGICHYFVTDGKIQYCGDCTHEYKGKTIDLPDIPEKYLRVES